MIFQALGARYAFGVALRHAFTRGISTDGHKLEDALAKRYGGKVVLYRKGRAALSEAIRLATGGSGAVAISGLTCYSVVQAVETAGCTPVFVDIRESDLHFGGDELSAAIKKHPEVTAVVIQNMLGVPSDITAIQEVARKYRLVVIEDLAHAAGAQYASGQEVGTVGDITMLSFGRDKAIDSVNGGALVVRRSFKDAPVHPRHFPTGIDQVRDRLYPLITWLTRLLYPVKLGQYIMAAAIKLKLVVRSADGEVRVDEGLPHWQANIALRQVRLLTTIAVRRREKTRRYLKYIKVAVPEGLRQQGSAPVRLPLLVDNRDAVVTHLKKHGIQANDIWYDIPVSPDRFYAKAQYPEDECPVAVRTAKRLLNLPTHERLDSNAIERIATLVNEVAQS